MAVLFIDVYRHIKMYILFGDIPCSIYLCKRKLCDFSINTFINDFPPNNRARESVQRQQKLRLWRVENRNNRRLKVRTYWDYWCLNKPRCIVSSVFISTFFNVNLDETVNTHTHTKYTWILHVCTLDTKWQTYIRMLKTWLAEFRREYVYVYIYLHIFKQCLYTIYNSI